MPKLPKKGSDSSQATGSSSKKPELKKLSKRAAAKAKEASVEPTFEKKGSAKERAAAWVAKINKMPHFQGVVQVSMAGDLNTPYYLRRPTGVIGLDLALGGGFHAGGCVQVFGPESVGKTFLAYRTAGEVQRNYGEDASILIVCTEIRPDKTFMRKAGCCVAYSPEEVVLFEEARLKDNLPPFTAEEKADLMTGIGAIVVEKAATGDELLNVVIQALKDDMFQLIIIESLGAMLTPDQDAGYVGDRTYGGTAGILTTFMNKIYPLYMVDRPDGSMLETTIIGVNQARAEINAAPHGPKYHAAAGAYAWRHAQLASVSLTKSSVIDKENPDLGRSIRWEIVKGKAGTHDGKKGIYNFYHVPKYEPILWSTVQREGLSWGVDGIADLVSTATSLAVVKVGGSWLSFENDKGESMLRCQGADKFVDALVADPELEKKVREECYRRAQIPVKFR
jgi:RecA/RadA recombinase